MEEIVTVLPISPHSVCITIAAQLCRVDGVSPMGTGLGVDRDGSLSEGKEGERRRGGRGGDHRYVSNAFVPEGANRDPVEALIAAAVQRIES